jgi:hypothetical protein
LANQTVGDIFEKFLVKKKTTQIKKKLWEYIITDFFVEN